MKKIFWFLTTSALILLLSPVTLFASDLSFSPASHTYKVGDHISVDVVVENNTQAINAVSGSVSFSSDTLSVSSINKNSSILKYWTTDPSYSNGAGTVHFEGVIPNPGFSGGRASVLTINFVAKAVGSANVAFTAGSVLANDGLATELVSALNQANYTIGEGSSQSVPTPVIGSIEIPVITSPTNPDQAMWYNNNNPVFNWVVPSGIDAIRLVYDSKPNSIPTKIYTPALATKTLESVADGSYFFHAQFKKGKKWGDVAHYGFQIDTVPPVPFTATVAYNDSKPFITFGTTDALSGMDHYEVSIDGGIPSMVGALESGVPYALTENIPGQHVVTITAFDKASNKTSTNISVLFVGKAPVTTDKTTVILLIILTLFILVGAVILWYSIIRFRIFKLRVKRELEYLSESIEDDFITLKDHIDIHQSTISPGVTKEKTTTKRLLKNSRSQLDLVERDLTHKIRHIEDKL